MPNTLAPFSAGDRVGKYEVKALLGRGGQAWVYRAYDAFLDRPVAIKAIPPPEKARRDFAKRARAEAQFLVRLLHQNVVRVFDATVHEGVVLIVMELLDGLPLREVLVEHAPLRVAEALPLFTKIAAGVSMAHGLGAIHRDLKPENVMVVDGNEPKVVDFGVAKFLGGSKLTTNKATIHGTLPYMSPEHLQGFGVTVKSDVYALGTMLYEALLGRHPCMLFAEEPTLHEIVMIQATRLPPMLHELDPRIPRHVARLVHRALSKRPDQRHPSMQALEADLRDAAERHASESLAAPVRELWKRTAPAPAEAPRGSGACADRVEVSGGPGGTEPLERQAKHAPAPLPSPGNEAVTKPVALSPAPERRPPQPASAEPVVVSPRSRSTPAKAQAARTRAFARAMAPLKYVLGAVLALALGFALGGGLFFSKQRRAASPAGAESARTPMEQRPPMRRAPGAPQLSTEPLSAAPSAAPVPVVELPAPAPAPTAALLPARKADARVMRKPAAPAPSSSVGPLWVEVTPQTASRSTTAMPRQKPTVDIETPLFGR